MNDLLDLIGRDTTLRRTCAKNGGEYSGPCPLCRRGTDRFKVWPAIGRWACLGPEAGRAGCDRGGDAIQYLRERDGLGYQEACARLHFPTDGPARGRADWTGGDPARGRADWTGGDPARGRADWTGGDATPRHLVTPSPVHPLTPPSPAWQSRAAAWAAECAQRLWTPEGAAALAWLHGRGLGDEVLRRFGIGYLDAEVREPHEAWGLQPPGGGAKEVWLPRGITIPWSIGGAVWRLNVRRPLSAAQVAAGHAKYIGPAGFGNGLYNADALPPLPLPPLPPPLPPAAGAPSGELAPGPDPQTCPELAVVLVEGEFDVLTVVQACAELAIPLAAVATGSTAGARRMVWVARLALAHRVLVAFDRDEAGEKAAAWWLGILPEARRWLPRGHDVNALPDPASVREWVEEGLAGEGQPAGTSVWTGSNGGRNV